MNDKRGNDLLGLPVKEMPSHTSSTNEISALLHLLNEKAQQPDELLSINRQLAEIYERDNRYDKALTHYFESLKYSESLKDSFEIAENANRIGYIYLITQSPDNAIRFFERALEIYSRKEVKTGVVTATSNIGAAYQKKQAFETALEYYKEALIKAVANGLFVNQGVLLGNIGSTYMTVGELDSGQVYLQKALELKMNYSPESSIVHTLNDLSELMLLMQRPKNAESYAQEAVVRAHRIGNANQLRYAHLNLANAAANSGDFEKAYKNFKSYYNINDSLFGVERKNLIHELQVKYESDKKDQAIIALNQEKKMANLVKTIYLIIGILLVMVSVSIYNWQRRRVKHQKRLLEREKELDQLKTNFFNNLSHEFRTPLSLILSPIRSMLDANPDSEQRKHLQMMENNAKRLLRLINQILELAKIDAGKDQIDLVRVNLVEELENLTASFEDLCAKKEISIAFHSPWSSAQVYCDYHKINTVVSNLISNAIKNTLPQGNIKVKLSSLTGAGIEIQVIDNGRGISENDIPFIFNRFYQATNRAYGGDEQMGSGIGLALVKQLVELQNGKISLQSELNEGTAFKIFLPIQIDQMELNSAAKPLEPNTEEWHTKAALPELEEDIESTENSSKPLVLVIEDNADMRAYLTTILSDLYAPLEAENGKAGIAVAQKTLPDLIISDVMMPELDGYETCLRLKQSEITSHIPVILLTAKASVASRISGLETEADLYLTKPFEPKELLLCAKNLIETRRKLRERYNKQIYLKPADISINSIDEAFLQRAMNILEAQYTNADFTVEDFGAEVGMSRSQLHRKLHALTNESASKFIRSFRLQKAKAMIANNAGTIAEISYQVGFNSPSYFNKCFLDYYGVTPSSVKG